MRLPHSVWDPGTGVARLAAGIGLWDKVNDRYLIPQPAADATHPGGSTLATPTAFFNVALATGDDLSSGRLRAMRSPAETWHRSTPTSTSRSSRPASTTTCPDSAAACRKPVR